MHAISYLRQSYKYVQLALRIYETSSWLLGRYQYNECTFKGKLLKYDLRIHEINSNVYSHIRLELNNFKHLSDSWGVEAADTSTPI